MDNFITANFMFFPLFGKKDEATDPWGKIFLYPFVIGCHNFTYIFFSFFYYLGVKVERVEM